MSKRQLLIILGVWVMFFLFLGFPQLWDKILSIIAGLVIIMVAYRVKPNSAVQTKKDMPFEEHRREAPVGDITSPNMPI